MPPTVPKRRYEMIVVDEKLCTGCSLCVPECPEAALSCFGWAKVSPDCVNCMACMDFCPSGALREMTSSEERDE